MSPKTTLRFHAIMARAAAGASEDALAAGARDRATAYAVEANGHHARAQSLLKALSQPGGYPTPDLRRA